MKTTLRDQFVAAFMAVCFVSVTLHSGRALAAPDTTAPRVLHAVVQKGAMGQNIEVRVQFQDQSEIFEPKLYFRRVGELEYAAIDLAQGAKGEWVGTIPATFVTRNLEYFLEAFDIMGNGPGRNGSPEKPHTITVVTRMDPPVGPVIIQPPPGPTGHTGPLGTTGPTDGGLGAVAPTPAYKTWWFWTLIILGVGGAAAAVALVATDPAHVINPAGNTPIKEVTIDVRGPDPRTGL